MTLLQNITKCMKSSCGITLFFLSCFFCTAVVAGPLHVAAKNNDLKKIEELITTGTDINARDKGFNLQTALHIAVRGEHFELVKLLLLHGANANIQNVFGLTPLHRAARKGYTDFVRLLLKHGADGNIKGKKITIGGYLATGSFPGYTPLHAAVDGGVLEIVQMLVDHGADVNAEARGAIFTKEEIIRYSEKSPLDLALLYEKKVPGPRKAIVEFLSRYNKMLHE